VTSTVPERGLVAAVWPLLLVLTVALATLAFGAVYDWGYWPLAVITAVLGVSGLTIGRGERWQERGLTLALAAVACAAILQVVPLPAHVVDRISPAAREFLLRYDMRYALDAVQPGANGLLDAPRPLSIRPDRTVIALGLFAAFSIWMIGLARGFTRTGVLRVVQGLLILGAALSVFAVIQLALLPKELFQAKVYGFWKPEGTGAIFGPFINRNHYAGWMLLAMPLGAGYLCALIERGLADVRPSWRDRILWLGSPAAGKILLVGFALVVMAVSLVLSRSRSGLAGMAVALASSAFVFVRTQQSRRRQVLAAATFVVLAGMVVWWAGRDTAVARLGSVSSEIEGRVGIWRDSLRIIRQFPLTGTGLNTFGFATLVYQTGTPMSEHYREAHNEYLQVAAEGGLLLGGPVLVALGALAIGIRRRFRTPDPNRLRYWLRAGAATGLFAIAVQSLVEFSLQMPANAALFALVAAIALHVGRPGTDGITAPHPRRDAPYSSPRHHRHSRYR
jgi:O-antigen ligase